MATPNPDLQKLLRDADGNLILGAGGQGQLQDQMRKGGVPSSPLGAAQGGADPQAAKMAGTPAQTSAPTALPRYTGTSGEGPKAGARLSDVLKFGTGAAQMSAQQAERERESARYQAQFGNLGSRIQSLIDGGSFFGGAPAPGAAPATPALTGDTSQLTPEQTASLQEVLKSGGSLESVAAATEALGGADISQYVNLDDLGQATADAATAATPDQIQLTPEVMQELGYEPAELAEALGVPVDQLGTKSVAELQETVERQLQSEFRDVDAQAAIVSDPAAGPNERAAARAALKEMGATGVFATDVEMQSLQDEVAGADTVEFRGEQIPLSQLLDDDFMSGVVKEYVDSDPDSDVRARLREEEPELAAWIDGHEGQLKELSVQLEGSLTEYGDIRQSNQALTDSLSTIGGLDEGTITDLLTQLDPDWGPYSTSKLDTSQYPGLQLLTDPAALEKFGASYGKEWDPQAFSAGIKELSEISPEAAAKVLSMSPEDIKKLRLGKRNSPRWNSYVDAVREWENLKKIDPKNPDSVAAYIFGPGSSYEDMQSKWESVLAQEEMDPSDPTYEKWATIFDQDGDMKMDSPAQIQKAVAAQFGGVDPTADPSKFGAAPKLLDQMREARPRNEFEQLLDQAIAERGYLSVDDLKRMDLSRIDPEQLVKYANMESLGRSEQNYIRTEYLMSQLPDTEARALESAGLSWDTVEDLESRDWKNMNPNLKQDSIKQLKAALGNMQKEGSRLIARVGKAPAAVTVQYNKLITRLYDLLRKAGVKARDI